MGNVMTEKQKETIKKVRHHFWRWIGSLFTEEKNGHTAVSLKRVLLVTLFAQCQWIWSGLSGQEDLPPGMKETLLVLIGAVTGTKIFENFKK